MPLSIFMGYLQCHFIQITQIYMSSDVETILLSFKDLFWQPNAENDLKQHYHELDAPLNRYLIGTGRFLAGKPPLNSDWDWSKTWPQNQANGALPGPDLLEIARVSVAVFFLLALILFYDLVRILFNPTTALLAGLILGLNPLILLHTRRAMAESMLVFTIIFFLWVLIRYPRQAFVSGCVLGLAFCAKQSAVMLIIPGLVGISAVLLQQKKWLSALKQIFIFLAAFLFISILLNPFAWSDPLHAIPDAFRLRQEFTARQEAGILEVSPEKNINSIPDKLASEIGAIYYQPLAVADVANYMENTSNAEKNYFSNPLNNLLRDPISSSLFLVAAMLGLGLLLVSITHQMIFSLNRILLVIAFLSIAIGLFLFIIVPFQRYYLPIIPFLSIWISFALTAPFNGLLQKKPNH